MAYCKACGEALRSPEEDMFDPESDEEYDGEHIKVVRGEKGERFQCTNSGQITKILDEPPEPDEGPDGGSGSGGSGKLGQPQERPVFDLPEDKDAMSILHSVIANPVYDLSEQQVDEVVSWGDIYDGQIPPDVLENLLSNLSGISKQKSNLMRQKYEAMLNKWIRQQSENNGPPRIGALAATPPQSYKQNAPQQGQQRQQAPPRQQPDNESEDEQSEEDHNEQTLSNNRRSRRVNRRQDVIDTMAEQMAMNMAEDAGQFYSDMREIMTTLVKKKAERDPEWFFEKADAFGFDVIDELATPSRAKQQESGQNRTQPSADMEVDDVLDGMMNDEAPPEPEPEPETPIQGDDNADPSHPMSAAPEEELEEEPSDESEEDAAFEEIMGDLEH